MEMTMMIDNTSGFAADIDAAFAAAEQAEKAEAEAKRTAAEKEEADRLEREEVARVARLKVIRGQYAIRQAIVKAAKEVHGMDASTTEDDSKLFIDGVECSWWIAVEQERSSTGYRYRSGPNGKLRLVVGEFGDRKSLPQRKDGSFNYEEAASILSGLVVRKKQREKAEATQAKNRNVAEEIREEFKLPEYHGLIAPSSNKEGSVKVDLSKIGAFTASPEKAREILAALRKCGVRLSYNDKP